MLAHLSFRICPHLHDGTWSILAGDVLLATHTSCCDAIDYALDMAETGWRDTGVTTDVALVDPQGEVCLWRAYGVRLH
ncbi:MAG TPA: hypothetical protein VLF18_12570 [Tahibacter sp.]|uniref:hypothetical protein n=1 Tax=Tahibacter sp. TaxID=2056211 RepID=UPI002B756903|nr:hypothetical protein [Tahibacter sp.]HSX61029.1 hypothetical protein [Tahibacter sp.]